MEFQKLTLSAVFIFTLLLMSCDNLLNPLEKGTCKVTITGYETKSYSERAIFENIQGLQGKNFFLLLEDISLPEDEYSIVEFSGLKPDLGTYKLINVEDYKDSDGKLIGRYDNSENQGNYQSVGGIINITYASDTELRGLFDFPAYGFLAINGGTKRVEIRSTGKFYAEEGSTGIILN